MQPVRYPRIRPRDLQTAIPEPITVTRRVGVVDSARIAEADERVATRDRAVEVRAAEVS